MLDSFFIAATGMHAEQAQIDAVANNLVNVNTMGYKKSRIAFETLMPQATALTNAGSGAAPSAHLFKGMGVSGANAILDFSAGALKQTQNELDFAIKGKGLFEVQLPDGSLAYSRDGSFHISNDGYLVNSDGYQLSAMIQIPSDVAQVLVGADGRIQLKMQGEERLVDAGYLELAHLANADGLKSIGNNLYVASEQSGEAVYSRAGENGAGEIAQGYLEGSNVEMIEELTTIMTAQRAYEANSRVLQASDEVLSIINGLRK